MDAKVLRAAVSAAIRVTVSTTLIGCGGTTSDAGHASTSPAAPAVKDTPTKADESEAKQAEPPTSSPTTPTTTTTGGSAPVTQAPTAGVASGGGSETGGMANASGAGGDESSAGAPAEVCGAAALACITSLEQVTQDVPLTVADQKCCDAILEAISLPPHLEAECYSEVHTRFMGGVARGRCCHDPSTWQTPACTPWGPPVPPELSLAALEAWSLAA